MHNNTHNDTHKDEFKEVNHSLGLSPRFGPFSGTQFVIFGGIFSAVFALLNFIIGASLFWSFAPAVWISLTCALLSGDKPYLFWGKIWPTVPNWIRGYTFYTSSVKKNRIGRRKIRATRTNKTKWFNPLEDYLHLTTMVKLQKDGVVVGAYLLNRNTKKTEDLEGIQLIFGFTCEGIHPIPRKPGQMSFYDKALASAYKELPPGEYFDFRWSSFCDDSDAQAFLNRRIHNPVSPESQFLDWAQWAKTEKLTADLERKNISLNVYSSFTVQLETENSDAVDRAISIFGTSMARYGEKLSEFWQRRFTKNGSQLTQSQLSKILTKAFEAANRHHQILTKAGLRPIYKNERELWNEFTRRIGSKSCDVPHVLVLDEMGLREEFGSNTGEYERPLKIALGHEQHALTIALNNTTPFADRRWVMVPTPDGRKKYIGVLTLAKKPAGFQGAKGQLRFLWDLLHPVANIEVITQLTPADSGLTRSTQQMITRQNRTLDLNTQARKTVEVSAQINVERSVDAQRRIHTGDTPLHIATVILVYRDTPEEVDDACRYIAGSVIPPTEFTRETEYAWLIWLQTLLVRYEPLLLRPFNRRLTFFASEASGVTNLIKTKKFDNTGFELIADEGGSPIKLDLSKPIHTLIGGASGAGKSLMVAQIATECLAQDMSFLIVDLPNKDGTGTFGDWTSYFNGLYFDIARESVNILEPLDLSGVPEDEHDERNRLHFSDIILIIQQLVLGSKSYDSLLPSRIEALIPLGLHAFYNNAEIKDRFKAGMAAPIGSAVHQNTPTLVDLERFYSTKFIKFDYDDADVDEALKFIRLKLKYWQYSSIGDAICKPTSFKSNGKLITFALTNLNPSNPKEAEIFGIAAYLAASRQELSSPKGCVFFMDEASVLLRYEPLSIMLGRKTATARKANSRVIAAFQDIVSVTRSAAGSQILDNAPLRFIGKLNPGAARSFSEEFNIPYEVIEKNEEFEPNMAQMYTHWLMDYQNTYTHCRYYPSPAILALTANARYEQMARDEFKRRYPHNKFKWVAEFAKHYVDCIQQGKPL